MNFLLKIRSAISGIVSRKMIGRFCKVAFLLGVFAVLPSCETGCIDADDNGQYETRTINVHPINQAIFTTGTASATPSTSSSIPAGINITLPTRSITNATTNANAKARWVDSGITVSPGKKVKLVVTGELQLKGKRVTKEIFLRDPFPSGTGFVINRGDSIIVNATMDGAGAPAVTASTTQSQASAHNIGSKTAPVVRCYKTARSATDTTDTGQDQYCRLTTGEGLVLIGTKVYAPSAGGTSTRSLSANPVLAAYGDRDKWQCELYPNIQSSDVPLDYMLQKNLNFVRNELSFGLCTHDATLTPDWNNLSFNSSTASNVIKHISTPKSGIQSAIGGTIIKAKERVEYIEAFSYFSGELKNTLGVNYQDVRDAYGGIMGTSYLQHQPGNTTLCSDRDKTRATCLDSPKDGRHNLDEGWDTEGLGHGMVIRLPYKRTAILFKQLKENAYYVKNGYNGTRGTCRYSAVNASDGALTYKGSSVSYGQGLADVNVLPITKKWITFNAPSKPRIVHSSGGNRIDKTPQFHAPPSEFQKPITQSINQLRSGGAKVAVFASDRIYGRHRPLDEGVCTNQRSDTCDSCNDDTQQGKCDSVDHMDYAYKPTGASYDQSSWEFCWPYRCDCTPGGYCAIRDRVWCLDDRMYYGCNYSRLNSEKDDNTHGNELSSQFVDFRRFCGVGLAVATVPHPPMVCSNGYAYLCDDHFVRRSVFDTCGVRAGSYTGGFMQCVSEMTGKRCYAGDVTAGTNNPTNPNKGICLLNAGGVRYRFFASRSGEAGSGESKESSITNNFHVFEDLSLAQASPVLTISSKSPHFAGLSSEDCGLMDVCYKESAAMTDKFKYRDSNGQCQEGYTSVRPAYIPNTMSISVGCADDANRDAGEILNVNSKPMKGFGRYNEAGVLQSDLVASSSDDVELEYYGGLFAPTAKSTDSTPRNNTRPLATSSFIVSNLKDTPVALSAYFASRGPDGQYSRNPNDYDGKMTLNISSAASAKQGQYLLLYIQEESNTLNPNQEFFFDARPTSAPAATAPTDQDVAILNNLGSNGVIHFKNLDQMDGVDGKTTFVANKKGKLWFKIVDVNTSPSSTQLSNPDVRSYFTGNNSDGQYIVFPDGVTAVSSNNYLNYNTGYYRVRIKAEKAASPNIFNALQGVAVNPIKDIIFGPIDATKSENCRNVQVGSNRSTRCVQGDRSLTAASTSVTPATCNRPPAERTAKADGLYQKFSTSSASWRSGSGLSAYSSCGIVEVAGRPKKICSYESKIIPIPAKSGIESMLFRYKLCSTTIGANPNCRDSGFFSYNSSDVVIPETAQTNSTAEAARLASAQTFYPGCYLNAPGKYAGGVNETTPSGDARITFFPRFGYLNPGSVFEVQNIYLGSNRPSEEGSPNDTPNPAATSNKCLSYRIFAASGGGSNGHDGTGGFAMSVADEPLGYGFYNANTISGYNGRDETPSAYHTKRFTDCADAAAQGVENCSNNLDTASNCKKLTFKVPETSLQSPLGVTAMMYENAPAELSNGHMCGPLGNNSGYYGLKFKVQIPLYEDGQTCTLTENNVTLSNLSGMVNPTETNYTDAAFGAYNFKRPSKYKCLTRVNHTAAANNAEPTDYSNITIESERDMPTVLKNCSTKSSGTNAGKRYCQVWALKQTANVGDCATWDATRPTKRAVTAVALANANCFQKIITQSEGPDGVEVDSSATDGELYNTSTVLNRELSDISEVSCEQPTGGSFGCSNLRACPTGTSQATGEYSSDVDTTNCPVRVSYEPIIKRVCSKPRDWQGSIIYKIFTGISNSQAYKSTFFISMILSIVIIGMKFLLGLEEMKAGFFYKQLFKIGVIVTMMSPINWKIYQRLIVNTVMNTALELNGYMTANFLGRDTTDMSASDIDAFGPIDQVFSIIFSATSMKKIMALLFSELYGWLFLIAIMVCVIIILISTLRALIIYLSTLIAMGVLLSVGPLFIVFLMFDRTKDYFDKWFKALISMVLQQFMLFTTLFIFSVLISEIFLAIISYKICVHTIIRIPVINVTILSFWKVAGSVPDYLKDPITLANGAEGVSDNFPSFFSIFALLSVVLIMKEFINFIVDAADGLIDGGMSQKDAFPAISKGLQGLESKAIGAGKAAVKAPFTAAGRLAGEVAERANSKRKEAGLTASNAASKLTDLRTGTTKGDRDLNSAANKMTDKAAAVVNKRAAGQPDDVKKKMTQDLAMKGLMQDDKFKNAFNDKLKKDIDAQMGAASLSDKKAELEKRMGDQGAFKKFIGDELNRLNHPIGPGISSSTAPANAASPAKPAAPGAGIGAAGGGAGPNQPNVATDRQDAQTLQGQPPADKQDPRDDGALGARDDGNGASDPIDVPLSSDDGSSGGAGAVVDQAGDTHSGGGIALNNKAPAAPAVQQDQQPLQVAPSDSSGGTVHVETAEMGVGTDFEIDTGSASGSMGGSVGMVDGGGGSGSAPSGLGTIPGSGGIGSIASQVADTANKKRVARNLRNFAAAARGAGKSSARSKQVGEMVGKMKSYSEPSSVTSSDSSDSDRRTGSIKSDSRQDFGLPATENPIVDSVDRTAHEPIVPETQRSDSSSDEFEQPAPSRQEESSTLEQRSEPQSVDLPESSVIEEEDSSSDSSSDAGSDWSSSEQDMSGFESGYESDTSKASSPRLSKKKGVPSYKTPNRRSVRPKFDSPTASSAAKAAGTLEKRIDVDQRHGLSTEGTKIKLKAAQETAQSLSTSRGGTTSGSKTPPDSRASSGSRTPPDSRTPRGPTTPRDKNKK